MAAWWGPRDAWQWKDEVLASIVVCFAQIPESVAFATLAHCGPAVGLHAAWIVGLVCALGGGRPGMINGSAGALASVTCGFVAAPVGGAASGAGVEELFVSVMGAGVLILIAALCRIGRFLSLVPATVMIGFCNGLAIVIGRAQLDWFKDADGTWMEGELLYCTAAHCCIAFLIMVALPRVTRQLPASLLAIIVGCLVEYFIFRGPLGVSTVTIGDKSRFARSQAVPQIFFFNSIYDVANIKSFRNIAVQGMTLAVVAMLESLMTLEVMNDLTRTPGKPNQQVWALGVANLIAGLFGTMGGNSLIELTIMNVQAGGSRRASATLVPLGVLLVILCASQVLNLIPAGSLAGIMVLVVIDTAKWASIPAVLAALVPEGVLAGPRPGGSASMAASGSGPSCGRRLKDQLRGRRIQKYDAFVIVLVSATTAVTNLAVAVFLGMFFECARFAWQSKKPLEIRVDDGTPGTRTYSLHGSLFFASKEKLTAAFDPERDPPVVEIDFAHAVVFDFSVLYDFHPLLGRYAERGTQVRIFNLKEATHLHGLLRFGTVEYGGVRKAGVDETLSFVSQR